MAPFVKARASRMPTVYNTMKHQHAFIAGGKCCLMTCRINSLGGSHSYTDCGGGSLPLCECVNVGSVPKGAVFYTLVP